MHVIEQLGHRELFALARTSRMMYKWLSATVWEERARDARRAPSDGGLLHKMLYRSTLASRSVLQRVLRDCTHEPWLHAALAATTTRGRTPLHAAVLNHCLAAIEMLLAVGVDANQPDRRGYTPLHYALHLAPDRFWVRGWRPAVRSHAISPADLRIARLLLEHGADINVRMLLTTDEEGDTGENRADAGYSLLHYAVVVARPKDEQFCSGKTLVKLGIDPTFCDAKGRTAAEIPYARGWYIPKYLRGAEKRWKKEHGQLPNTPVIGESAA